MELCARCHKRPAIVFITQLGPNAESKNQGLCLQCARELGIKPVQDIMEKMGIDAEELEHLENILPVELDKEESDEDKNGRAPAMDLSKLFNGFQMPNAQEGDASSKTEGNTKTKKTSGRKYLDSYCINLTRRAQKGELDSIVGRERELARMIQILCRRQKNNPCLIGEPGVGKTAIAEALAEHIVKGEVPYKLLSKEVYMLDMTSLVAGTQFRGQFETRMKGLIEEIKTLKNVILFIDEVHSIVGAGDAEGSMSAANILKPALSRGEVQVIGSTTLTEYRKYIEKDAALERRFQPIMVEEPSIEETIRILNGIKKYYEVFHDIKISEETIRKAVLYSERYITDRYLPDKAIDVIDEAASYLSLNTPIISEKQKVGEALESYRLKREKIEDEIEKTSLEATSDLEQKYKYLADIKVEELKNHTKYDELVKACEQVELTTEHLAKVIEIWTGIPASSITESEYERIEKLDERLKTRIVGQNEAIEGITRAIKRNRAGIAYKRKPVSFIFAGPTGVGKTELVKTLAAELFDSPETLIRLDMSEFMEKHSVSRLIGSPPGYVGYDDAGQLTEKIRRKPYSVILFDEIEKAHPDVLNIMLQILDDGRLTDAHGRVVNFENTIIVMTTNAGSNYSTSAMGFSADSHKQLENTTTKALSDFLRPEFLNRVDEVITFRALDEQDFAAIVKIMLGDLQKALAEKGIACSYTEDAARNIAKQSFSKTYGARNMRRYIQKNVEDLIATQIINNYQKEIQAISIDYNTELQQVIISCI